MDDNLLLNQAHLMTFSPIDVLVYVHMCVGGEAGSLRLLMKTGIYTTTTN